MPAAFRILAALAAALATAAVAFGLQTTPESRPLKVGVTEMRPFAFAGPQGKWHGYAVNLWEDTCRAEGIPFQYVPFATLAELVQAVEAGTVDAAAIASAPTAERLGKIEYTVPFEISNISIASRVDRKATVLSLLEHLIAPPLPFLYLLVFLVVILLGIAVRMAERRGNRRDHLAHPDSTVGESIWWAAVTFFTVGYGDLVPRTPVGRSLTVVAMVISAIVLSLMTGAVGSAITIRSLKGASAGPDDLDRMRCAIVRGSATHDWTTRNGVPVTEFATMVEAAQALVDGTADATLGERFSLRDAVQDLNLGGIVVDDVRFTRKSLSFPVRMGFPEEIRHRLNRAILKVSDTDTWRRSVQDDLGLEQ